MTIRSSCEDLDSLRPAPLALASGIVNRIVQEFQEWLASVLQLFFEPRGAVAISAGPGLGAVLVPASAAVVGLPHLHQLKIPLPVRTLFLQR